MVGRFIVCAGTAGAADWAVFDNAAGGNRGSGLSEDAAYRLAADLELQFDVYGPRSAAHVRKVDPPVAVERADAAWVPVGFVDAWVLERGVWVARVKDRASRYSWIPGTELRRAGQF